MSPLFASTEERFMSHVQKGSGDNDCWIWTGGCNQQGYGNFRVGIKIEKAHRVSYRLFVGDLDDNLLVCHTCDNPPCVRPDHLFVGTQSENVEDMFQKGRGNRASGEGHGSHKLNNSDVEYIRSSSKSNTELAEELNVSRGMIWRIRKGMNWKIL